MKNIIFLIIPFLITGCLHIQDVKPWQKGTHAKDTMQDAGIDKMRMKFDAHIYYSKEATKAGFGVAGGGCGCN